MIHKRLFFGECVGVIVLWLCAEGAVGQTSLPIPDEVLDALSECKSAPEAAEHSADTSDKITKRFGLDENKSHALNSIFERWPGCFVALDEQSGLLRTIYNINAHFEDISHLWVSSAICNKDISMLIGTDESLELVPFLPGSSNEVAVSMKTQGWVEYRRLKAGIPVEGDRVRFHFQHQSKPNEVILNRIAVRWHKIDEAAPLDAVLDAAPFIEQIESEGHDITTFDLVYAGDGNTFSGSLAYRAVTLYGTPVCQHSVRQIEGIV
jgi:hypothetical protein